MQLGILKLLLDQTAHLAVLDRFPIGTEGYLSPQALSFPWRRGGPDLLGLFVVLGLAGLEEVLDREAVVLDPEVGEEGVVAGERVDDLSQPLAPTVRPTRAVSHRN